MASRIVRQEHSDPTTVRAAIYARVSTLNGSQDPSMQTRELEEYCERRGWQIHDIYVDSGVSGKKDSRPQLNRMMQDAHACRRNTCSQGEGRAKAGAETNERELKARRLCRLFRPW